MGKHRTLVIEAGGERVKQLHAEGCNAGSEHPMAQVAKTFKQYSSHSPDLQTCDSL